LHAGLPLLHNLRLPRDGSDHFDVPDSPLIVSTRSAERTQLCQSNERHFARYCWQLAGIASVVMEIEIVLLYGWLIYMSAVILAPRARRFSLRDLLLFLSVVAFVLFFISQRGVMFLLVTLIAVTLALLRVFKRA
jgi:hypothetical protein